MLLLQNNKIIFGFVKQNFSYFITILPQMKLSIEVTGSHYGQTAVKHIHDLEYKREKIGLTSPASYIHPLLQK